MLGFLEPFCGTAREGFSFSSLVLCSLSKPGWRNIGGRVLNTVDRKIYWISLNALLMVVTVQYVCNGLLGWGGKCFTVEAAAREGAEQTVSDRQGGTGSPIAAEGRGEVVLPWPASSPKSQTFNHIRWKPDFDAGCAVLPSTQVAAIPWNVLNERE